MLTEIITPAEVISLSLSEGAFDPALIELDIIVAQRKYIRPFLGDEFYDEIVDQVENSTLTPDNQELLDDYLKSALAYFIIDSAWARIAVNISSKGIVKNTSETTTPASANESHLIRNSYRTKADDWLNEAEYFIGKQKENDNTKYPLFRQDCATSDRSVRNTGPILY